MSPSVPVVLALDASYLRVGWAVVRMPDGAPVGCGALDVGGWITRKTGPGRRAGPAIDYPEQVRRVLRSVHYAIEAAAGGLKWHPSVIAVERAAGGLSIQTSLDMSLVSGSFAQAAQRRYAEHRPELEMPRPPEWRSQAGVPRVPDPEHPRKQLTGRQRTSAVCEWIGEQELPTGVDIEDVRSRVWAVSSQGKPEVMATAILLGFDPDLQDAADAACIAHAVATTRSASS